MFSLRELMLIVAVVAFGIAGLWLDAAGASALLAFTLCLVTVVAVYALVGSGRTRTFASGFVVAAFCYVAGCLFYTTFLGGDIDRSALSNRVISPIYERVVRREYLNNNTGQPLPADDPNRDQIRSAGGFMGVNGKSIFVTETPNRIPFVDAFHALVLLAYSYLFGKLAVFVASRRQASADDAS
ncbi:MAG: hypothetical protein AAGG48_10570 [Planctomycetota bacterium]